MLKKLKPHRLNGQITPNNKHFSAKYASFPSLDYMRVRGNGRTAKLDFFFLKNSSHSSSDTFSGDLDLKIKVCLWNTDNAPGGNKVQKSYF